VGCTVVLDVGKTSAKLCAVDASGKLLAERRRANAVLAGPPYPHLDVEGIFGWAIEGLARISADHAVDAVVPVAHGACAALLAGSALALPVLDYEFAGVAEFDAEYEPLARDFAATRSPRLPAGLNLGRQLFWLERRFPAEFARVTDILLWPQYWSWRLGGAKCTEVTSLGCHTDLWQPSARGFSRLARERGWAARFPPLAPAWRRTGNVLAGAHDSNASCLAHRAARTAPFVVVSTGTWFVCLAHGALLDRLDPSQDMLANVDVHGEPVATARFMGGREFESTSATLGATRAAEQLASRTAECLDRLGALGDVIVEGPFARDGAYCSALAALRMPQPVWSSDDSTGTVAGACLLASWPTRVREPKLTRRHSR
jgi:sugar (pentulose or hexulose) kinase